ncbi:hypothetical protein OG978_34070 [Streptomyces sp. NBC_01591]|nr:hypothetical protein [Streptomyces sp. NBC_01591]WSD71988.1 hypothetical protein OG978_34070 [Streptomyces sp. NBC_01591]
MLERGGVIGGYRAPFLTADGELWWDSKDSHELNGEPLTPAPTMPTA